MNRGKLVLLGILVIAVVAAGFAWWFQSQQGDRALAFWGSETAQAIRLARPVTAMRLAPMDVASTSDETVLVDGQTYRVAAIHDMTEARGMVHARQSLIEDRSFAWNDAGSTRPPNWEYAIRFGDRDRFGEHITVFMDLNDRRIRQLNDPRIARLMMADGWRAFLSEHFETDP